MKRWFTILAATTAVFSTACTNDRDTLAFEARRFPGIFESISGRFERNPAAYYQMRIDRIDQQGGPKTLGEYDDQAVAYDRLGDDDKAIEIMKAKWQRMSAMGEAASKMDRYRYHANLGTFQAHRWVHNGADPKLISEMKIAAGNIEKSIELNPNAHFGREEVQLQVMRWIIDVKSKQTTMSLGEWMVDKVGFDRQDQQKAVAGLMGLVVLGAAWESIDVYEALGALSAPEIATFISLRIGELQGNGKKNISGTNFVAKERMVGTTHREYYKKIRANAEEFNKKRTEFMVGRFAEGKHPDTHPDFWAGYVEVPPVAPLPMRLAQPIVTMRNMVIGGASLLILIAIGLYIRQQVKGRSVKPSTVR